MNEVMSGSATPAQIGAFVVALRSKGETAAEVAGMAEAMLGHANRVTIGTPAVDVVGTGGGPSGPGEGSPKRAPGTAPPRGPGGKHGKPAGAAPRGLGGGA